MWETGTRTGMRDSRAMTLSWYSYANSRTGMRGENHDNSSNHNRWKPILMKFNPLNWVSRQSQDEPKEPEESKEPKESKEIETQVKFDHRTTPDLDSIILTKPSLLKTIWSRYKKIISILIVLIITIIILVMMSIWGNSYQEFLRKYESMGSKCHHHKLCSDVDQYSGYLKISDKKSIFFWYFESQDNKPDAPLILWLNGGPGTSSLVGLMTGVGPCKINEFENGTIDNPHSWNKQARLLIFDQPLGTGFTRRSVNVTDSETASDDIVDGLHAFYKSFPKLRDYPLHIASESYGGRFVPMSANRIIQHNKLVSLIDSKYRLPLNSIILGNSLIEPNIQFQSYYHTVCHTPYPNPELTKLCTEFTTTFQPEIENLLSECQINGPSSSNCTKLISYIQYRLYPHFYENKVDIYDVRNKHYIYSDNEEIIERYFNRPEVQIELGVEISHFNCNQREVILDFYKSNEMAISTLPLLASILDHHLHLLLYAGDADLICSWSGMTSLADAIPWSHRREFQLQKGRDLLFGNFSFKWQERQWGPLSLIRIPEAGHFVSFNQPANLQSLILNWLDSH